VAECTALSGLSVRPFFVKVSLAALTALIQPGGSLASDTDASGYRFETYAGADYDGRAASLTSSTVWSPFGPLNEPGFRLKLDGLADVYGNSNASVFSSSFLAADVKGLGAIMAGYQLQIGSFWLKAYAGAAYEEQLMAFWTIGQLTTQQNWGAAGSLESYWQMTGRLWASIALSWIQPDNSGALYERVAYDFYSAGDWKIAAGAEAGLMLGGADTFKEGKALDDYNSYSRMGALLDIRYGANDLCVSGGLANASDDGSLRPYASIRYGRKF